MLKYRRSALILTGGFCLAFLGTLATVGSIWSSRAAALREWERHLSSVAHMLSAHAGQSIGAADLVLRNISEKVNEYRVGDEQEMRWLLSSYHMHEILREAAKGLPQINSISVVGLDGAVLNLSREFPPQPVNLSDRDYFLAHMEDSALDVLLSRPVQTRGNGAWAFYLARKLKSPEGKTLGLVLTGIRSDFFSIFYQSVGLDVSSVSLFRLDGAMLSQHVPNVVMPPDGQMSASIMRLMRQRGHGIELSGDDPKPSEYAFDQMTAFFRNPLLSVGVSVSASREQVLREWGQEAVKSTIQRGVIVSILIAATILLSRLISQLEQARNLALSAMEAKTRFASNVSHELRTPLNAIIGGSYQMMQTGLAPDTLRFAQIVSSSAQQLMVLINDILDYSYYEARHFRIEKAPFHVREMINETVEMTRAIMSETTLELVCKVDAQVPAVILGDSGRIKQVLLNLLSNGVKYTERGKVELRVSYIKTLKSENNLLVLQVRDTGLGMSAEDQARVFQPFERTVAGSKRPGTGLGLTICKKLIEAMSGEIRLLSRVGEGTHFTVELPAPLAPADQIFALQKQTAGEPNGVAHFAKSLRILVAEDVAPSRMLLTIMLEKMGHAVTAVENGSQAVQAASVEDFDLIMMDLQMPEMDGAKATQAIRAAGGYNSTTRILAVSANADMEGPNGLSTLGFDDALLKPITPERLSFVIGAIAAQA